MFQNFLRIFFCRPIYLTSFVFSMHERGIRMAGSQIGRRSVRFPSIRVLCYVKILCNSVEYFIKLVALLLILIIFYFIFRVNIIFIDKEGKKRPVRGKVGDNVLYLAHRYGIELEGKCAALNLISTF